MDLGLSPTFDEQGLPVCSPGLRKLLLEGDSGFHSARLIAMNPTLLAQARELAPKVTEALRPLTASELFALLDQHAPGFGLDVPDGEQAVFWNAYYRELQTYPLTSVEQAMLAWKRGEWDKKSDLWASICPQPYQLAHFAKPHQVVLGQMRHRLAKALHQAGSPPREIPEEERQTVAMGLRDLAATFKPKELPSDMRLRLSPQEVAARIREQAGPADEDVVL